MNIPENRPFTEDRQSTLITDYQTKTSRIMFPKNKLIKYNRLDYYCPICKHWLLKVTQETCSSHRNQCIQYHNGGK